jgi:hypothetical protein
MARCGSIAAPKRTPTQESLPIGLPQALMRFAWFPAAELGQINVGCERGFAQLRPKNLSRRRQSGERPN